MKIGSVIYTFLTICLILIAHTAMLKTGRAEDQSTVQIHDLSDHPIYSKYKFNNTENIINLGTQPFFSPTGLITEAMKRGTVLHNVLSGSGAEVLAKSSWHLLSGGARLPHSREDSEIRSKAVGSFIMSF